MRASKSKEVTNGGLVEAKRKLMKARGSKEKTNERKWKLMRTSKSKEETDGGQVPSGSKEEINESKWKLMRASKSK